MSSKKYLINIYPKAQNDLLEVKEYFSNKLKTSPNNLFQKFYQSLDLLETNPLIYPLVKDTFLYNLEYRMFAIDNFLIFYVVKNNEVQIHRFLYGKRDYLSIL